MAKKMRVDLVELAKRRWIDQMSYREIGKSMGITRGQVDWNLKKV
jgi:DNA-directed RNA polymerase specialized sigma24 family protein